jgi:hypothetical protein
MPNAEQEFENELEVNRGEVDSAVQFFYAWNSVHAVATKSAAVLATLNSAPLFWNTALGALQSSAFIALGRVFDQDQDTHNVDRLPRLGQRNLQIFSIDALAARKRRLNASAEEWLPAYLQVAYVPTHDDFRRLRKHVATRRRVYEANIRPMRHNVFAHRHLTHLTDPDSLFGALKISEMQQVLIFLWRVHAALWELLANGRKPTLRPARYSVERMFEQPQLIGSTLPERLARETEAFLRATAQEGGPY